MKIPIVFVDLRERDLIQKRQLEAEQSELLQRKHRNGDTLPDDQEKRLQAIGGVLELAKDQDPRSNPNNKVLDPTFRRLREKLSELTQTDPGEHVGGKFLTQLPTRPGNLKPEEKRLAALYGLLEADGILNSYDPRLDVNRALTIATARLSSQSQPAVPAAVVRFDESISKALGEYTARQDLFEGVLQVLVTDGDISQQQQFQADQWVRVVRALKNDQIPASDPLLPLKVRVALGKVAGASDGVPSSTIAIDLPDLDERADVEIAESNLHAVQAFYFAAMLDEMKLFTAMDLALEQWQLGMIVLGRGSAGDRFYKYWRASTDRLSEMERRSFYSRIFGLPGGTATQGTANRDFKGLWMRFLSATSRFYRQIQVDALLQANIPASVSQEQVRQSGRDLAANLSLHGFGFAYFAAAELQQQIEDIIATFSDEEVKRAYGAADMFQVVEQILSFSGSEIGNTVQKRVSANAGAIIIRWLADNRLKLSSSSLGEVLNIQSLRNPMPRMPGTKATTSPTDYDLVNAVEQWLTVNGIQDQYIEEQAQAQEPPRTPTRPFPVSDIVRDYLPDLPVPIAASAGIGGRSGNGNGHAGNGYRRR